MINNTLHFNNPQLIYEWDFVKNQKLGLNYFIITKGSNKKVWWYCAKCKSSYDMQVCTKSQGSGCPYCSGYRVNHTNSLAIISPSLASEWHPTKNGKWKPETTYYRTTKKFWWLGKCGHEWETVLRNRVRRGDGCPYCSGRRAIKGSTDIHTTRPDVAELLLNKEDSYTLKEFSEVRVDWKCSCGNIIKNKMPKTVSLFGLSCPSCSDGISYPAKVMFNTLKQCNITNKPEKVFSWLRDRRYDFYLPEHNLIIEVQGDQHSGKGFSTLGGRTLEEEQENDKYKYEMAMENGIDKYVFIDARISEIGHIRNSIENSFLSKILNLEDVNWEIVDKTSRSSNVSRAVEMFEKGLSKKEIAKELGVIPITVHNYLKRLNRV